MVCVDAIDAPIRSANRVGGDPAVDNARGDMRRDSLPEGSAAGATPSWRSEKDM